MKLAAQLASLNCPAVPPFEVKIYSHKRSGKRAATDWLKGELQALAEKGDVARKKNPLKLP
jgi:hypothetical protein